MELKSRLRQARNRLLLTVFTQRLALSLAVTLTAVAALVLLGPLLGIAVSQLGLLLGALAAALLASLLMTALTDSGFLRTARLLEEGDPSLHARLSTALELAEQGSNTSPLRQAQLRGATELAGRLDAKQRIPLRLPRLSAAALLGGTSLMAAAVLIGSPLQARSAVQQAASTQPAADFSGGEQASLASGLQQLAEQFATQPDSENDPYLEAIGRQLLELGTRMESEALTREQLGAELERLLQHTRTALELREEQGSPAPPLDLTELLEAAVREVRQPEEQLLAEAPGESSPEVSEAETGPQFDGSQDTDAATAETRPPSLEELLAAQDNDDPETGQGQAGAQQGQAFGSYFDYAIDERSMAELNARAMEQAMNEAAGEAIGASSQSQEGASSLAGDGTDDLFGSESAERLNAERIEQMVVNEETDPDGRHVRIEVNPDAEFTEVFATPLGDTAWSRSSESEVQREVLVTDQRAVTARYHTPEQAE